MGNNFFLKNDQKDRVAEKGWRSETETRERKHACRGEGAKKQKLRETGVVER